MPAAEWTQRSIDAPNKTVLTAADVAHLLGYTSESSIPNLVTAGQLPAPLRRGGTNVWTWEDVVLCVLLIKSAHRMQPAAEPAEDEPVQTRPNSPNRAQSPPKTPKGSQPVEDRESTR